MSAREAPPKPAPPAVEPFSVIGKRNRKVEGRRKVTGQALYTDDLVLPRMLHAALVIDGISVDTAKR